MTCDGETLSAASLELRARFAGSLEKMKVVAERAKQRQDAARPALIKREREDQQKYHRRLSYLQFYIRIEIIMMNNLTAMSIDRNLVFILHMETWNIFPSVHWKTDFH